VLEADFVFIGILNVLLKTGGLFFQYLEDQHCKFESVSVSEIQRNSLNFSQYSTTEKNKRC